MTYPRTLSEALLLIDAQEERIKELLSAQSETRDTIIEECAKVCDDYAAQVSPVRGKAMAALIRALKNAAPQDGGGSQPVDCEHQEGYVAADSRQNSPTKIPADLPAGAAPSTASAARFTVNAMGPQSCRAPSRPQINGTIGGPNGDTWGCPCGANEKNPECRYVPSSEAATSDREMMLAQQCTAERLRANAAEEELARARSTIADFTMRPDYDPNRTVSATGGKT